MNTDSGSLQNFNEINWNSLEVQNGYGTHGRNFVFGQGDETYKHGAGYYITVGDAIDVETGDEKTYKLPQVLEDFIEFHIRHARTEKVLEIKRALEL